jgi:hypothetical protein
VRNQSSPSLLITLTVPSTATALELVPLEVKMPNASNSVVSAHANHMSLDVNVTNA